MGLVLNRHLSLNKINARRSASTPYVALITCSNILLYALSSSFSIPWADTINSVVLAICLFYAAVSGVLILWKHAELLPSSRAAINVAALSLIIYPLVSLADVFHFLYPWFRSDAPVWFQSHPLYFIIVQIPLIVYIKKGLIHVEDKKQAPLIQVYNLSNREMSVAMLLLEGASYKDIASKLNIY